ncbi:MAG: HupE/UreJ family protein [Gemmatimonadota bacterium]|nr:MAG: HupE/UreJ family protein [Gemmatimonadota bacterium]
MGSEFVVYFRLGIEHIADLRGYDHILFIAALTVAYALKQWRQLLILVTSFTLGHSITLALATVGAIRVNSTLVEVLIPITILVTSVFNIADSGVAQNSDGGSDRMRRHQSVLYALAGGFGLIHGLGFSSFLRAVLGAEQSIVVPLFAFNVGLEIGQILIVAVLFVIGAALTQWARTSRRDWLLVVSGGTAAVALTLLIDRI